MSNATDYAKQAELALASYSQLAANISETQYLFALRDSGRGMSAKQAETFASTYTIVTQYNDTVAEGGMGTSFSATVFKDASGNLTLAIRGTLEAGDFVPTDANIAASGAGYDQIVAMWNWWLRVSNPAGVLVAQYRLVPVPINPNQAVDLNGLWLEPMASATATGMLVGAINADGDRKLDITGHSLGGHLAMAFGSLFAGVTNQITVFNAPGFSNTSANQNFFTRLGGSIPSGVNTTNVIADEAPVGVAPWLAIAGLHSRPGEAVNISIENQWLSDEPNSPSAKNHSQQSLADALVVYATLTKLDPALATATFKSVLGGAVAGTAASLERIVDALETLFGINTDKLAFGNANRDALYQALYGIQSNSIYQSLQGTVQIESLISKPAAALQTAAANPDGMAYRYALKELNPFAVIGDNSLYTQFNQNGELNLYDPASGQGQLTAEWLEDRAAFLTWKLKLNTEDIVTSAGNPYNPSGTPAQYFEDKATQDTLTLGPREINNTNANRHRFIFGRDQTDGSTETLSSGGIEDRLYGGAGDDILNGEGGNDYLEGGQGNDTLIGGGGTDTYRIDKTSGTDTIIDYGADDPLESLANLLRGNAGDGQGTIRYNGQTLAGTLTQDGEIRNRYHSAANPDLQIRFIGGDGNRGNLLIIDPAGAKIIVQNWKSGELGLSLDSSAATVQTTDLTGDGSDNNSQLSGRPHGENLVAGAPNQKVYGLGGADVIDLAFAGDIGYGGAGNDVIRNGEGAQTLYGEDGNDILIASSGDDVLYGGTGDDALQGGADDDVLDGGDGMDFLDGGQGSDVIRGGAGDDFILGGGNLTVNLSTFTGPYDYNHFADDQIAMLHRNGAGQIDLPSGLIGVSPTNAHAYETGYTHVQGDAADAIDAGTGDDLVLAGDGDDVIQGGEGKDYLVGQVGGEGLVGWTLDAFHGDDWRRRITHRFRRWRYGDRRDKTKVGAGDTAIEMEYHGRMAA